MAPPSPPPLPAAAPPSPEAAASTSAASGSMARSRERASSGVAAVMVTCPTLRPGAMPDLPYQCTAAPGVCART